MNQCCDIGKIINEFQAQLLGYLIKKVKNTALAEDITQEVMLKLISAHRKNIKIHNIKAWLFEVARHAIVDYYKNTQNIPTKDLDNQTESEVYDLDNSEFSPVNYLLPMLKLLPKKYSAPLFLSDIENLPQKIVSEKLGLSLSATKMRIQRARKMLYELFITCCDIEYTKKGAFANCTLKESCYLLL